MQIDSVAADPHGPGQGGSPAAAPRYMCPIRLLKAWLRTLKNSDPEGAARPLFRKVDRYGQLGTGLRGDAVGVIL
jgi:hypothetical protein